MISRRVRIQLVVFVLIAAVGVIYVGGQYAGLNRLFGRGGYSVSVELADSGGIFPNAEVTYRGVVVGLVSGLRLSRTGVIADLLINDTAPPIPADTAAVVANRSPIGEQAIDLRPDHVGGPLLADGSVIPVRRTTLPPTPSDVLTDADRLFSSVPTDSLRTVVMELGTAFAGTGPSLRQLIDGAGEFSQTATEHLPQTVELLDHAHTVLATQREQGAEIVDYSRGLHQIAAQFKESDGDLRGIIDHAPEATDEIKSLLDRVGNPLADVARNTIVVAEISGARTPGLEQTLVAAPMISRLVKSLINPDNTFRLSESVLNLYDPRPCTKGYEGTIQRSPNELGPVKANPDVHCAEPPGSPTSVRGSQNAPRPGH